jgi:hypothetical protein
MKAETLRVFKMSSAFVLAPLLVAWSLTTVAAGQASPSGQATSSAVPRLVKFSGVVKDEKGLPQSGVAGVTFALYKDQSGGAPLWLETQNVQADAKGNYTVQLGATKTEGLSLDLFTSGEARWLGVTVNGGLEQPRVLLLSVPYALKAADAETIGGLPPSAFVLAAPSASGAANVTGDASAARSSSTPPPTASNVTTTGGTVNALPLWTTSTNIQSSALSQTGTGATAKVGVNTTTPVSTLDVNGTGTVRGNLSLPATGTATATAGKNSQPNTLTASAFNSGTGTPVSQNFRWQAEPTGNNTTSASGTLNLLYGSGSNPIKETGLKIGSNGQLTFATGQTFPGTGPGTITGITTGSGSGLAGGGTSGTLNMSIPVAGVTNTMLQHSSLTVNPGSGLSGGGAVSLGGTTTLGLLTSCISGQLLKWNGSAWACDNDLNSGGTVTSVGLSASSSDFIVSGSPVTSSGMLGLNWNVAPTSASTANAIVKRDNTGSFNANSVFASFVQGLTSVAGGAGIEGYAAATGISNSIGVFGVSNDNGYGVMGENVSSGYGVYGTSSSGTGVYGTSFGSSGYGVYGASSGSTSTGVFGTSSGGSGTGVFGSGQTGVWGQSTTAGNVGSGGYFLGFNAPSDSGLDGSTGMEAFGGNGDPNSKFSFGGLGVYGQGGTGGGTGGNSSDGPGGFFQGGSGSSFVGGDGIDVAAGSGLAGNFSGDLVVTGVITAGTKDFKIDHPLDPANKYLVHASVESSEMMNIYTGNVSTDAQGEATVRLPEWFEALNTDFRYQLTVIGQFAQAIVAHEIQNHEFSIRTNLPNVKVSWQVTGVRQDAFAKAHPLVVEEEKDERLRGFYIHPELHGAPAEKQIEWARHPEMMKRMKQRPANLPQPARLPQSAKLAAPAKP